MKPVFRTLQLLAGVALALATAAGCASDKSVIANATQMHQALEPAVISDPQLNTYINTVGQRVINVARELDRQGFGPGEHRSEDSQWMYSNHMQFHFVNSKTLNAFTTGGNHMYVYTELFRECQSEDELAAVMAHEYGHVYARHVQKGMDRQYAILAATLGAAGAGYAVGGDNKEQYATYFAGAAQLAGGFVGMGFTRKDESQADELGFAFYVRAGWDPSKFGDFFQHMIDKGLDTTPALLSDHPELAERVQVAKQRAAGLPAQAAQWRQPNVATPAGFQALQQRSTAVGATMPDDQSLQQAQQLLQAFPRSCFNPVEQPDQTAAKKKVLDESNQILESRSKRNQK